MMIYYSKADLLRGIGKSSRDTRLVDRMIERGEILVRNGVYEYLGGEKVVGEGGDVKSCNREKEVAKSCEVGIDEVVIKKEEYANLRRVARGVKLLDSGYREIIDRLIQYKKSEEKEEVKEEIKEMKGRVAKEIDK